MTYKKTNLVPQPCFCTFHQNVFLLLLLCLVLQHKFRKFQTLDGERTHKARFGLSVACAGNINLDGITAENRRSVRQKS